MAQLARTMNHVAFGKGMLRTLIVLIIAQLVGFLAGLVLGRMHLPESRLVQYVVIIAIVVYLFSTLFTGYSVAKLDVPRPILGGAVAAGVFQAAMLFLNFLMIDQRLPGSIIVTSVALAMLLGVVGASIRIFQNQHTARNAQ
jgi:hypothetical protein